MKIYCIGEVEIINQKEQITEQYVCYYISFLLQNAQMCMYKEKRSGELYPKVLTVVLFRSRNVYFFIFAYHFS